MGASRERYARADDGPPQSGLQPVGAKELDALLFREEARRRSLALWVCAGLWVTLSFTDLPMSPASVALRLVLAGCALLFGWQWERIARTAPEAISAIGTTVMLACYLGLVVVTGGAESMNFPWTLVLPLGCVVILPVNPWALSGISSVYAAGCIWVLHAGGMDGDALWASTSDYVASIAVAAGAAHQLRSLRRGELLALASLQTVQSRAFESERLAMVGRLAAGVAHEINNPLAYVKSNVAFLAREHARRSPEDEELKELTEETEVGIQRIEAIVSDLKGFARNAPISRAAFELSDAVAEALRMTRLRTERVAQLELALPSLPEVLGDRRRLVQVLVNLLVNAAEALEGAPRDPVPTGRIRLGATVVCPLPLPGEPRPAPRVILTVHDSGPGLAEAHLKSLFTPFFTTKPVGKGTGLGLALSRSYMEQMGGQLTAENHPAGGALFRLELLAVTPTEDAGPELPVPSPPNAALRLGAV